MCSCAACVCICRDNVVNFKKQISTAMHMNRQDIVFSLKLCYTIDQKHIIHRHTPYMYMHVCTNVATYVPALAWSVNMCECPVAAQSENIHMDIRPIL